MCVRVGVRVCVGGCVDVSGWMWMDVCVGRWVDVGGCGWMCVWMWVGVWVDICGCVFVDVCFILNGTTWKVYHDKMNN